MVLAKSGAAGIVLDRGDLGCVVGEGLLEGGKEMFRRNLRKRRGLERRLPRLQERVGRILRGGRHLLGFRHDDVPFCVPNDWHKLYHAMGLFWAFCA